MIGVGRQRLQKWFLQECIEEQVLPKTFPRNLRSDEHPFTEKARVELEKAVRELEEKVKKAEERTPPKLKEREKAEIEAKLAKKERSLRNKLRLLCENSNWHTIGRRELVHNLSNVDLTKDQLSALSLGLKFATGTGGSDTGRLLASNNRRDLSDLDQGFVQGIIFALETMSREERRPVLPRRFLHALKDLKSKNDVVITSPDKGGGVAILSYEDYLSKMGTILSDSTKYVPIPDGTCKREALDFNQQARKILKETSAGKKFLWKLEETPVAPRMRGGPKIHKIGVPLRPITSGIGSAPHKLAKMLAKPLSGMLGGICDSHIKNSTDLKNRLRNTGVRNKKLVSFDVESLFTNVPIPEALSAVREVLEMKNFDLPLPMAQFIALVELCVKYNSFTFEGKEYRQVHGMAMGSPLSPVLACLFMESFEKSRIKPIIGAHTRYFRYVDDCLVLLPRREKTSTTLDAINGLHPNIKFTMEEECDEKLPFLDMMLHRNGNNLKFSVYRKPTNRDDFIHYFSAHDARTKSGTVIGFYLRALRICDAEFLNDELDYIAKAFGNLCYPKNFLQGCLAKARAIRQRPKSKDKVKEETLRVIGPSTKATKILNSTTGPKVDIIGTCGDRIGDMVLHRPRKTPNPNSVVYSIPCVNCDRPYIGESHLGLDARLRGHKYEFRTAKESNALFQHWKKTGHEPNFGDAKVLMQCRDRTTRKLQESIFIARGSNLNIMRSSHRVAPLLAEIINQTPGRPQ